jgi:tRNA (mo5U34)-methyltransferase
MGVLYHHCLPQTVLTSLYAALSESGTLILETLIIDGEGDDVLIPQKRYANMRNVYCIPTVSVLISWLHFAGFKQVSVVDISQTTPREQRATEWSSPRSLHDFLDPLNPKLTIEGYPAPIRAMLKCQK